MMSRLVGWGVVLLSRICGQRNDLGFRRHASGSILAAGTACIGRLLWPAGHIAILLLCWLDVFVQRLGQLRSGRKARRSASFGGFRHARSGIPQLVRLRLRRAECRRIAVGLKPLGRTSSG